MLENPIFLNIIDDLMLSEMKPEDAWTIFSSDEARNLEVSKLLDSSKFGISTALISQKAQTL
jgi:hypothetical protein